MVWFFNTAVQKRLSQFNQLLKASFAKVRQDTGLIFQWINYLYRKQLEIEERINSLQAPQITAEQIKQVIDEHYALDTLNSRIAQLHNAVYELKSRRSSIPPEISDTLSRIIYRLEQLERKKQEVRANLKEKLIRNITRNSKDYITNLIISLIRKYENITALQLKEMVVEEQGLCSKSSFYRVLGEIEESGDINVVWKGKEKTFFSKIMKTA